MAMDGYQYFFDKAVCTVGMRAKVHGRCGQRPTTAIDRVIWRPFCS